MQRLKELLTLIFLLPFIIYGCGNKPSDSSGQVAEGQFIRSKNGMVVSAHPESSRIGVKILLKGGNAVDAAAATEFALAVCYPEAGNIGGGGFMLIRTASGNLEVIDYREKAPSAASRDMYLDSSRNIIDGLSTDTYLASGVPGTVDGIIKVHSKYGILPFKEIIQPAIDLAENGFPLPPHQARSLNSRRKEFIERNRVKPAFVKDSLWKEGDTLKQPDLANTLKLIRDFGRNGFYSGKTASLIDEAMKRGNGLITQKDLKDYSAQWRKPLTGEYRAFKIITIPPPSSGGIILLQLLGMTENYTFHRSAFHSPEQVHLMTEAERRAFADRAQYMGDPDFVRVPVKGLLNRKYLAERMKSFSPAKASTSSGTGPGNPLPYESEETTHYSVVDKWGNAVSATTTLNGTFGTCIVVEGAGFLLNNEMDDFSAKPGHPNMYGLTGSEANAISPGKRMLSSMTPAIVERNGRLFLVLGSPGGSTIPTSVYQIIVNVIDYGMDIEEAVKSGRFHHQWMPDQINYEKNALSDETITVLTSMGHSLKAVSAIGRVNAIMVKDDGNNQSGADPRGLNSACGY